MQRREFLATSLAAGGSAFLLSAPSLGHAAPNSVMDVAIIGAGLQGRTLINCLLAIGGVRIRALCDIWKYRRMSALTYLETYQQQPAEFEDYREMLDEVKGLHAAFVATPDFVHAEQTIACLNAGLHVYCEPPMAPTLDAAQSMADTAKKTGKLLAIGYQRRSNPRYHHVSKHLLQEAKLLDDITAAGTQWNQWELEELGWPRRRAMADADLKKYGYANMREFRNWRWFKRYSAGPFAGFAVQQIDVLNWLLGSRPKAVMAVGGSDYFRDRQNYDNVTAVYEYPLGDRVIHAPCQVLTTSRGSNGNYELLVGTQGSIRISDDPKWTKVFREPTAADWDPWTKKGYLAKVSTSSTARGESSGEPTESNEIRAQETGEVTQYEIPVTLDNSPVQPHLENFLDAVRGKATLNCPAEAALTSEAAVLKALEAVEAKRGLSC